MKVLKGRMVEVYDDKGNLIEERDATLEDLLDILTSTYVIETVTIDTPEGRKSVGVFKRGELSERLIVS